MKKREEFNLEFTISNSGGYNSAYCNHLGDVNSLMFIAYVLTSVPWQDLEEYVLNEIIKAENSLPFDPEFWTDYLTTDVLISPPLVEFSDNNHTIDMTDFRILLEEWIEYCKSNS